MAKLADAQGLGPCGSDPVGVRPSPPALRMDFAKTFFTTLFIGYFLISFFRGMPHVLRGALCL